VGKETKVSRAESKVLRKKTKKFQKVGVLEGKSRSAKASAYLCTPVRATREENEIFTNGENLWFSTKEEMLWGAICSHYKSVGVNKTENKKSFHFRFSPKNNTVR